MHPKEIVFPLSTFLPQACMGRLVCRTTDSLDSHNLLQTNIENVMNHLHILRSQHVSSFCIRTISPVPYGIAYKCVQWWAGGGDQFTTFFSLCYTWDHLDFLSKIYMPNDSNRCPPQTFANPYMSVQTLPTDVLKFWENMYISIYRCRDSIQ